MELPPSDGTACAAIPVGSLRVTGLLPVGVGVLGLHVPLAAGQGIAAQEAPQRRVVVPRPQVDAAVGGTRFRLVLLGLSTGRGWATPL